MTTRPRPHRESSRHVLGIYALMVAIGPLSIDMYLPAMPRIREDLGASWSQMQATMAVYLIGLAFGQLAYGPLSDAYGRKKPLIGGLALYVLTSLGCALATEVQALIALRALQAVGASAGAVTVRAMIRDSHAPRDVAAALSLLTAVMGVAPIIAPLMGGVVLEWLGWRSIFTLLSLWAAAMLLIASRLAETRPHAPGRLSWRNTWPGTSRLLRHRKFRRFAFAGAVTHSSLLAYLSSAPIIFAAGYQLGTTAMGALFAFSGASYILGAYLNRWLLRTVDPFHLMRRGMALHLGASTGMLAFSLTSTGGLGALLVTVSLMMASIGVVAPNAAALALAPFRERTGLAASLMGFLQYASAATAAFIVGVFATGSAIPLALTLVMIGLLAQGAIRTRPRRAPP